MNKAETIAQKILVESTKHDFTLSINEDNTVLTVSKSFQKGDNDAFVNCDVVAPHILALCPSTQPGSVWGTDGGSVGGHTALINGSFRLNKSGCSKRVLQALRKMLTEK